MNKIVLFILCIFFTESYSQCEDDKHYKYYHDLIQTERDNIQKVFDGILEKYGDVDKVLEDLLKKLNETINKAEQELNVLENLNEDRQDENTESKARLDSLLGDLKTIEDELELIKFNKSWNDEKEDAEKSANKTIPRPTSVDIMGQKNELEKWQKFLDDLNKSNYINNITNLPHSVSDELNILEKLITEEPLTNCFDKFHNDLKLLFIELANLFDLDIFKEDLDNIKEKNAQNKEGADEILSDTKQFLDKEKELKDIHYLTNQTLALAEEIEKLKKSINSLSENNEAIINERLKKLQEEHEAEVEKLYEKYNVKEGQALLNELKRTKEQIENVNVNDVNKDIDNYLREIEYYTCILEKCEGGTETISTCERKQ